MSIFTQRELKERNYRSISVLDTSASRIESYLVSEPDLSTMLLL